MAGTVQLFLFMGLDLYVVKGDEVFFGERLSSYIGFDEFRKSWAQLLGFDLEDMQGFGGRQPWTTEPLQCFFDHADCEGEISWQDAEQILVEARKDAPKLPNHDWAFLLLIPACETAVAHKLPISFIEWLVPFVSKPVLTGTWPFASPERRNVDAS